MRSEVKCVYCQEVMGWFSENKTVDEDGKEKLTIILEDNPELHPICPQVPDGQHANMTPEQAIAQGLA